MTETVPSWSDERVDLLRRLWQDGLSASQVATQLGGVTRNAVIGKVHRLGLSGRVAKGPDTLPRKKPVREGAGQEPGQPESADHETGHRDTEIQGLGIDAPMLGTVGRDSEPSGTAAVEAGSVVAMQPAPADTRAAPVLVARIEAVGLAASRRVTIMDLRESMCRWPLGDPTSPDFHYCGDRAITGLPYCTHHAQIAYQPAAERKRDRRVGGFR
ncbi:hypothetical protein ASF27_03385 [Methylobacterium sp. Leaf102]|uniref:GcrA family cell cycle regulator n=1 Tax=Methylobacterium sp. Leaf102 TaxID=1736253 RepID=UPI0006F6892F|nr:GcrA family cell cycle regulator [Methylobacterium sp. Leaf102]KQP34593.1 hypothetical protein ASF27_03385 [Methylobacterium sp. Leaf102]